MIRRGALHLHVDWPRGRKINALESAMHSRVSHTSPQDGVGVGKGLILSDFFSLAV